MLKLSSSEKNYHTVDPAENQNLEPHISCAAAFGKLHPQCFTVLVVVYPVSTTASSHRNIDCS